MQLTFVISLFLVLLAPVASADTAPAKMRALLMTGYGGPEVLKLDEVATPTPSRDARFCASESLKVAA